jgi:hypothetical protein
VLRVAVATAGIAAFVPFALAHADGEAGIVIHWGDGRVSTHCIAFEGESTTGDRLLERAGYDINQFSGLVCAIDDVGCEHSGSFDSCTCECQSGGGDCTYWGFFRQPYGDTWFYSALGAFSARVEDGDLQGWKWGKGGPASAPAPPATTFEAVCGHSPGVVSTVPAGTTPTTGGASPTAALPAATVTSAAVSPTATLLPAASASPSPGSPAPASDNAAAPTVDSASATIPLSTPTAPSAGDRDNGGPGAALAFAGVAGALLVAFGGALAWRSRRGP